jgi:hypothetical protein
MRKQPVLSRGALGLWEPKSALPSAQRVGAHVEDRGRFARLQIAHLVRKVKSSIAK